MTSFVWRWNAHVVLLERHNIMLKEFFVLRFSCMIGCHICEVSKVPGKNTLENVLIQIAGSVGITRLHKNPIFGQKPLFVTLETDVY